MTKFFLMTGNPGSGKTYFAKQFAKDNDLLYLCPDDFYKIYNGTCTADNHRHEFEVWMALWQAIHIAEKDRKSCIVDTNSPTVTDREQFLNWFPNFDEYNLINIKASRELCHRNNKSRVRVIPKLYLDKLINDYQDVVYNKENRWDYIHFYDNENNNIKKIMTIKKGEYINE